MTIAVAAFIGTAFAEDDAGAARPQWRQVADQFRPTVPKLATLMDAAETDVLAYMTFPKEHRAKLHSTNPIEPLNDEIKPNRGRRHLPQRSRHHTTCRRHPARERRIGGSEIQVHDAGPEG